MQRAPFEPPPRMERGVYFDAWYPRQHCYHPSLPPRRLRMLDDLVDYRATVLVWSALGGGSISLPYLEQEAYQDIDSRFRFYGFVNDAEFIAECDRLGIKVFGIVFEVQGWEFPAELSEDEDKVLALNELRGVGKQGWLGLREFSQGRYPKLWKPLTDYFPDGLENSDGERVDDLLEECVSRDIHGNPCHATWVECPGHDHYCYLMDRNNPVWREYMKAIIRIQIDAGVHGVQLDEADYPYSATRYGGCFCKDCTKLFRAYLQRLPEPPAELEGVDLESFHYGEWLLAQGYDFKTNQETAPLFWEYLRFQRSTIVGYFAELADYAREYGRSKGRDVLVSGNFYELLPHYYAFAQHADMLITELDVTAYSDPAWCRYAAGFAGDKPVVVVENPYYGVVPDMVEKLKAGKGYDLYRTTMYEAAALGINMSVPYGSWMGSVIEDSFWAPHDVSTEIQEFLADNERLFSRTTYSEVAVVHSVESTYRSMERRGVNDYRSVPFWDTTRQLVDARQPFDVVVFPEGRLREDEVTADTLSRYRVLVLPDVTYVTDAQARALAGFQERGGIVVAVGDVAAEVEPTLQLDPGGFDVQALPGGPQVEVTPDVPLAINVQRIPEGAAVHLIRYDYDHAADCVPVLDELHVSVRIERPFRMVDVVAPGGHEMTARLVKRGRTHGFELRNVPLYSVLLLRG